MQSVAEYTCVYCGESNLVFVDLKVSGCQSCIENCLLCCRPNALSIQVDAETLDITLESTCEAEPTQ